MNNFGYIIWKFGTKIVKLGTIKKMIVSNESMTKCVVWWVLISGTACSLGVSLHIIVGAPP